MNFGQTWRLGSDRIRKHCYGEVWSFRLRIYNQPPRLNKFRLTLNKHTQQNKQKIVQPGVKRT